jgi:hypothetical protein
VPWNVWQCVVARPASCLCLELVHGGTPPELRTPFYLNQTARSLLLSEMPSLDDIDLVA